MIQAHDGTLLLHCRENRTAHLRQQLFVAPGSIGDQMMQRLMHSPNVVGSQARGHRLDALALARKQQPLAVGLQRIDPVSVPCGLRQAFEICRKAFLLWAWRGSLPTKQFYIKLFCL